MQVFVRYTSPAFIVCSTSSLTFTRLNTFCPTIKINNHPSHRSFSQKVHSFVFRPNRTISSTNTPFGSDSKDSNSDSNSDREEQSELNSTQNSSAQNLLQRLEEEGGLDVTDGGIEAISKKNETEIGRRIYNSSSVLEFFLSYLPKGLNKDLDEYLTTPLRILPASAIFLLIGFFAATSATTIIGSVADWDPLAAAVLLIVTEGFTKFYYQTPKVRSSRLLQLINSFKVGLIYGMTVEALKLCT